MKFLVTPKNSDSIVVRFEDFNRMPKANKKTDLYKAIKWMTKETASRSLELENGTVIEKIENRN